MQVLRYQRLASLAALPFYIVLFPFGSLLHALFGGIALGYAFQAVSSTGWDEIFERMRGRKPNAWTIILVGLVGAWVLLPMIICMTLRALSPDVSIGLADKFETLLAFTPFPSSLPQYRVQFASEIGASAASHYVIGMYVLAVAPLLLAIVAPLFLVRFALLGIYMRRKKLAPYRFDWTFWILLFMGVFGVAGFYMLDFKVTHDVGVPAVEPFQSFANAPICFWPVQMTALLWLTAVVDVAVCAALARDVLPETVEKYLPTAFPIAASIAQKR